MDIKLHANARTTPAVRAYIQRSAKSGLALSRELGVSVQTVYKWRKAERVYDGSHVRHNLGQSTSPLHEKVIWELRTRVRLSEGRHCGSDEPLFPGEFQPQRGASVFGEVGGEPSAEGEGGGAVGGEV